MITVKFICKFAWDDDYNDTESEKYQNLVDVITEWLTNILAPILEKYGLHLNLKFKVIGPSRRRRGVDEFVPEIELNLNLSGEMNSNEDLPTVGQTATSEINTQVISSVAEGGDGEFIDETEVPETQELDFCSIEASTTFCETDRVGVMIPICAMPEDAVPYLGSDKSCTGQVSGDYLVFEATSDCPLDRTKNGTHSTHTGSVNWVDGHRGAVISRQRVVKVSFYYFDK